MNFILRVCYYDTVHVTLEAQGTIKLKIQNVILNKLSFFFVCLIEYLFEADIPKIYFLVHPGIYSLAA